MPITDFKGEGLDTDGAFSSATLMVDPVVSEALANSASGACAFGSDTKYSMTAAPIRCVTINHVGASVEREFVFISDTNG